MKWYPFDPAKGSYQKRPPIGRCVLIQFAEEKGIPAGIAVGYMKNAAGDKQSPQFIRPGIRKDGEPLFWCDCLGDDFEAPLWQNKTMNKENR
jgi:hypothetical protein